MMRASKCIIIGILIAITDVCFSSKRYENDELGTFVGPFEQLLHDVSGLLYFVDNKTLRIQNFIYDGQGPATVFWIGLKGKHTLNVDDTGIPLLDENGESGPLKRYQNANITLTLQEGIHTHDLLWFAVWCQFFKVDFGHVFISNHLNFKPFEEKVQN